MEHTALIRELNDAPDLHVSSGAFGIQDLNELLAKARSWRMPRSELSAGLKREDALAEGLTSATDLSFLVHNYFPPPVKSFVLNLAPKVPGTLELNRVHCPTAVDLSHALSARWVSVYAKFLAEFE
jgi:hypothetical protein